MTSGPVRQTFQVTISKHVECFCRGQENKVENGVRYNGLLTVLTMLSSDRFDLLLLSSTSPSSLSIEPRKEDSLRNCSKNDI